MSSITLEVPLPPAAIWSTPETRGADRLMICILRVERWGAERRHRRSIAGTRVSTIAIKRMRRNFSPYEYTASLTA